MMKEEFSYMKKRSLTQQLVQIGLLIALLFLLPLFVLTSQTVQTYFIRAFGVDAKLVVDVTRTNGQLEPVWQLFAQGGEESADMIAPVMAEVTQLNPRYIRIDHIFDHFDVVSRGGDGKLILSFAKLDPLITSIIKTGAKPFISLSYMPPALGTTGDITGKPKDWNEWKHIVQQTIEHISGKTNRNLTDVYYEVWNEPDLFGNWRTYGDKNYLTLYEYAALGAREAQSTNAFKFGGPATTKLYKNWVREFAKSVTEKSLPLDFISWHLYSTNPLDYAENIADAREWLTEFPQLAQVPLIISEWGLDSNVNPRYDTKFAGAHTTAVIRQLIPTRTQAYSFELVDGRDPEGNALWGRWGLITHPSFGATPKLRYEVFKLLNRLVGDLLIVTGEGTWVTAIATKDNQTIRILLTNYDANESHVEKTPLTISNLQNGTYTITQTRLGSQATTRSEVISGTFQTELIMPVNSVLLIELTKEP